MGVIRTSIAGLKPIIYVAWIVAAIRFAAEAGTTDLNFIAMASVYMAIFVIFLLAGFTGQLDALVWKPLLVGSLVLGIACWLLPNGIAYGVAQFRGWNHGRFHHDYEFRAAEERHRKAGNDDEQAVKKAEAELGRSDQTRCPPVADTSAGKLLTALSLAGGTGLAGTVWSLLFGTLFVGIPASVRRRRAGPPPSR